MSSLFGGGGSTAKEQQRRIAIAQANQRGRAKTILGSSLGSPENTTQRKTALGV